MTSTPTSPPVRKEAMNDTEKRLLDCALTLFADGGLVWTEGAFDRRVERLGVGVEVKNSVRIGTFMEFGHALGIAQLAVDLGTQDNYEIYYRIRGAVPF